MVPAVEGVLSEMKHRVTLLRILIKLNGIFLGLARLSDSWVSFCKSDRA